MGRHTARENEVITRRVRVPRLVRTSRLGPVAQVARVPRIASAFVAALLCLVGIIAVPALGRAATLTATVDDNITSGTNRFTYSGSWTMCGGCNSTAYQNSFRYAYTTGAAATFTFSGTQAKIYGYAEPMGGIASVSVDGGAAVDVDFYSSTQGLKNVFSTAVLANGAHTVKLTVSGRRASGTSPTINVDKAEVYTEGGTTPSPTTTSTTTTPSPTTTSTTTTPSPTTTSTTTKPSTTTTSTTTTPSPTTTSTTSTTPPSGTPVTVDDNVTTGTNRFTYTGSSWTTCGGCNSAYQGGFRYAYTTGNSATFTFSGTQARLYGFKEPVGGIATVSVDGGAAVDVDYYSQTQALTPTFTTAVLTNGTHTVTMTVSGRRGSGASPTINLDKADVYSSGSTPTPTTTTTTTPSPTTTTPSPTTTKPSTTTTSPATTGLVSVTIDDGAVGGYLNARPALRANGLHATFNIVSDALSWPDYMTPAQAKDLVADGDEIGNHSKAHPDLAAMTAAQIDAEFSASQSAISSLVGVTPTTCAYPFGSFNATVTTEAAKFFKACRTTNGGQNPVTGFARYQLVTFYCQTTTTAADITNAINTAKANNTWVIFIYHGVGSVQSADDVTTAVFASHMAAIRASGVPAKTMGEVANG